MTSETSVSYIRLTRLIAQEDFIEFSRHETFRSYNKTTKYQQNYRLRKDIYATNRTYTKCNHERHEDILKPLTGHIQNYQGKWGEHVNMRAVCKVRGLALLLRVGILWRCGDGLFFEVPYLGKRCTSYNAPPTSRKHAADHCSLRNVLPPRSSLFTIGKAQKSHVARSELNSVFGLEKVDRWNPIRTSAIQSRSGPMQFIGFSNHEKEALRQEISK
jgi:hypothetical protein